MFYFSGGVTALGNNAKLPTTPKSNRPVKTSTLFKQDNNSSWTSLFKSRFTNVKAVMGKHPPSNKPLVVNPGPKNNPKHTEHLANSGINYEVPLSPITVAANRAERISRERDRNVQDQNRLEDLNHFFRNLTLFQSN